MKNTVVINALGYAGLIPFLAAAAAVTMDMSIGPLDAGEVFLTYSAIILSFLGGALWGKARELLESSLSISLLLLSNLFALSAWAVLLLGESWLIPGLLISMTGFSALYLVERITADRLLAEVGPVYLQFRWTLTVVVCAAHLVVMIAV